MFSKQTLRHIAFLLSLQLALFSVFIFDSKQVHAKESDINPNIDTTSTAKQTGFLKKIGHTIYCSIAGLFSNTCELQGTQSVSVNSIPSSQSTVGESRQFQFENIQPIAQDVVLPPVSQLSVDTQITSQEQSSTFIGLLIQFINLRFAVLKQEILNEVGTPSVVYRSNNSSGGVSSDTLSRQTDKIIENINDSIDSISTLSNLTSLTNTGTTNLSGATNISGALTLSGSAGLAGQVLTSTGTSTAPEWTSVSVDSVDVNALSIIEVGNDNTASGNFSSVFGYRNTASGYYSSASGYANTASGDNSSASGYQNTASGRNSSAFGRSNTASGNYSLSSGFNSTASGIYTSSVGYQNTASGNFSSVFGYTNTASTLNSTIFGRSNFTGTGVANVGLGILNNQSGGTISTSTGVITGTIVAANSGALSTAVGIRNLTAGGTSIAVGYRNTASGGSSSALGFQNTASGSSAVGLGSLNTAGSPYSVAVGYNNTATHNYGGNSTAVGYANVSTGAGSSAFGDGNIVSEDGASAFGSNVNNSTVSSLELGPSNAAKLQLTSTYFRPFSNNTQTLGGASNRWTEVYATNGTIQTSDARLKKDIEELSYGLDTIMQLRPVSYNWIDDSNAQRQLGLIAQEVLEVMPEVVNIADDADNTLGINYAGLIPTVIVAIQDIAHQVDWMGEYITRTTDGIIGMFESIVVKRLKVTDELELDGDLKLKGNICIDEVCITKDQFKDLLQNNGGSQQTPSDNTTPSSGGSSDTPDDTSTPTDPVSDTPVDTSGADTNTDTPVDSEPAPQPNPTPESEPAPESTPEQEPIPESEPEPEPAPQSEPSI